MSHRPREFKAALAVWLSGYASLVYAAGSLRIDLQGYDWLSLGFALAAGLFGGVARTIYTLTSDRFVVLSVWRELTKDLIVAMIGGGVAYVLIQAADSLDSITVTRDIRIMLVAGAGWSRGRWFGVVNRGAENLVANAMNKARGGAPVDVPSSAAVPLETKP